MTIFYAMPLLIVVPPDVRLYGVGIGALLVALLALWVFWKVSKFVLQAFVTLLLLGAVAAALSLFQQR